MIQSRMCLLVMIIFLVKISMETTLSQRPNVRLVGGGATFPSAVYDAWMPVFQYEREMYVELTKDFLEQGSGEGKHLMMHDANGTSIDYGASDAVLTSEERQQYPDLVAFPVLAG